MRVAPLPGWREIGWDADIRRSVTGLMTRGPMESRRLVDAVVAETDHPKSEAVVVIWLMVREGLIESFTRDDGLAFRWCSA